LAPDQVVVDSGRQLALWGSPVASDAVERAVGRIQVMLGHAAVTRPVLTGGRGPGEQVSKIPWGDRLETVPAAEAPWPGRLPDPAPAVVHPEPQPVLVVDEDGLPVTVSGRCEVSAPPAEILLAGEPLAVTGWTGPWPAHEQWWDASVARRLARFQVATDDGRAWLLLVEGGQWLVEACYA
jgi:protein ImuB